jgi:hypothetical protein
MQSRFPLEAKIREQEAQRQATSVPVATVLRGVVSMLQDLNILVLEYSRTCCILVLESMLQDLLYSSTRIQQRMSS